MVRRVVVGVVGGGLWIKDIVVWLCRFHNEDADTDADGLLRASCSLFPLFVTRTKVALTLSDLWARTERRDDDRICGPWVLKVLRKVYTPPWFRPKNLGVSEILLLLVFVSLYKTCQPALGYEVRKDRQDDQALSDGLGISRRRNGGMGNGGGRGGGSVESRSEPPKVGRKERPEE